MAVRVESQAEPIPGYKLIERLGGGGFGEVWKAEAPGGLMKAIKFVYGDIRPQEDGDSSRAGQELKALSRVKTVHHPYILSLERYDIIDGQLIIVMELADRTLWDRFRDCRSQGLPGIPRPELLNYLEETAEALDLMNTQYQLQHLDIKPQNLFLIHNHVKVADFGLVKDLEGMAASVTGGVTPVYAAPETFDGWVSRFSDQYSLGIVYQELLTGTRPFGGTTMRQLVMQHLQAIPDLTPLPMAERPIIGRALAKNPDERYPSCLEMIQALRQAEQTIILPTSLAAIPETPAAPAPPPIQAEAIGPSETTGSADDDPEMTRNARARRSNLPPVLEAAPPSEPPAAVGQMPVEMPPPAAAPKPKAVGPYQESPHRPAQQVRQEEVKQAPAKESTASPPAGADTGVQPAVVLGLGELGREVLRHLRQELTDQVGAAKNLPFLRLLNVDIDPDAVRAAAAGPEEAVLQNQEVLITRLHRPTHYLKPQMGKPALDPWLNSKVLYRIPRQQNCAGIRSLGRLAFVDNYLSICRRVLAELEAATEAVRQRLSGQSEALLPPPRVYIVASLGGGTGGGMLLDMAFVVRHLLKKLGHPRAEVIGLLLLPSVTQQTAKQPAVANAYAALAELHHYSAPGAVYSALFESTEGGSQYQHLEEKGPPFQRCLLLEMPELVNKPGANPKQDSGWNKTLARAGLYLLTDLLSPVGKMAAEVRRQWGRLAEPRQGTTDNTPLYQTCGMYRILWPRQRLLQMWAQNLCRRLVQRWMNKDAKPITEDIRSWVQRQWEGNRLPLDNLIARHQEGAEQRLHKTPEAMFSEVLQPAIAPLTPPAGVNPAEFSPHLGPVVQVLAQLEQLVGIPEECRPQPMGPITQPAELPLVEKVLSEAATRIAAEADQKLAELIVLLIEDPRYRMSGAEEAIRQFNGLVQQALENLEQLAKDLQERAVLVYQRMQTLLETPAAPAQAGSIWKTFVRRPSGGTNPSAELLDLLRSFPKFRYQSLILQRITSLYLSLRGHLSDQMREIGFCRQRLSELADLIRDRSPDLGLVERPLAPTASLSVDLYLFPNNRVDLLSALKQVEERLTAADELAFDQRIQTVLRRQFGALVQVCMASSSMLRMLAPLLQDEAQAFLEDYLEEASVVDMYLARNDGREEGQLLKGLRKAYDRAAPPLHGAARGKHLCLVSLPSSTTGGPFRDTLRHVTADARILLSHRSEEIFLYREYFQLALTDLEQFGPLAKEAYLQRLAADPNCLHSRGDITDWGDVTR